MLENIIFTLSYVILSAFLVYPPDEFVSAGFTIPSLFSALLGTENENFILYHVKRSIVTLLVYSCLPVGYIALLIFTNYVQEAGDGVSVIASDSVLWKCFFATSLVLPLLALYVVRNWTRNDFQHHPICSNLIKFSNNNNNDWRSVASVINAEFRRFDKISIQTNPLIKIIATENWIMKVNSFTIQLAHQSDTTLLVKDADVHDISAQNATATQFLNIEVKSTRTSDLFDIRINSTDFKDLEDRIARDIAILPNVKFHKSVVDEFAEVFKETIAANAKYETGEAFEECIGCMQARPNVKLRKLCGEEGAQGGERCENCFCRPMWCADCMAKWFASRQEGPRGSWLGAKATCPMCRARFCLLDVSLIDS